MAVRFRVNILLRGFIRLLMKLGSIWFQNPDFKSIIVYRGLKSGGISKIPVHLVSKKYEIRISICLSK